MQKVTLFICCNIYPLAKTHGIHVVTVTVSTENKKLVALSHLGSKNYPVDAGLFFKSFFYIAVVCLKNIIMQ